jgi:putative SOS response-associated peptidase YedK
VAEIHERMPLVLGQSDYVRWLGEASDASDLMRLFPAEPMRMWPASASLKMTILQSSNQSSWAA